MAGNEPIFTVTDRWGAEIVLTKDRWAKIVGKHPEVAPYVALVSETITRPNVVYEGRYQETTKVFYAKGLIQDDPFRGCWVQVVVRYTESPATVSTCLLAGRIAAKLGRVIYLER